jgi:hypothetical protein
MESIKPKLLIKGTICNLYIESSNYVSDNLCLCFCLFGLFILV